MAKAKKLPSGQWRTLVYSHTDADGKRKYENFTADGKKESEYLAAEFALNKKEKKKEKKQKMPDIAFSKARVDYILSNVDVLSPSTLRGYNQMQTYFSMLDDTILPKLTQELVQQWADDFSKTHAPKTVKNAHGFISVLMKSYDRSFQLHTKLPKKKKIKYHVPTEFEISRLIHFLQENDTEMLKAVLLAGFGTLRRSEVCGLTSDDIKGNVIHVKGARVKDMYNNYVDKDTTKNEESDRYVEMPKFVIDAIPNFGKVELLEPDVITKRHATYLKRLGIHHFRFHDLRHYSASVMHAIGVPDQYIMARGGWSSDDVLKKIYRGTMDDYEKMFSDKTNEHFEKLCNTKCNTKK